MAADKKKPSQRRVRGSVRNADGTVASGLTVGVYNRRLQSKDELLGKQVKTNDLGEYLFNYSAQGPVDLYVSVAEGKQVVATAPLVLDATADETIDIHVGDRQRIPSDFDRIIADLAKAESAGTKGTGNLADLDERDIALLSAKIGVEPREIVLVRQSAALASDTKLPPELFYAFGKQRMVLSLPGILAQDPEKRREALKNAQAANQIRPDFAKDVETALAELDKLKVEQALRAPAKANETTLGSLLGVSGLAPERLTGLAKSYAEHSGSNEDFWKSIRQSGSVKNEEVEKLQLVLQLGAVTQGHAPLVQALVEKHKLKAVSDLARLGKAEWLTLIGIGDASGAGVPPELAAAGVKNIEYADMLYAIVEDAFPTAIIANRVAELPDSELLKNFYSQNPAFDMRSESVETYLRSNGRTETLKKLGNEKVQVTTLKRLKGIERIYRIAPKGARADTIVALISKTGDAKRSIDSAQKISTMGRSAFVRRFGKQLGAEDAEIMYRRANNAAATATVLVAQHSAGFDQTTMNVLPKRAEQLKKFPDYESLFGSLDFCSCEHCQSVYSPAAYLVDVLHWLENRPSENAGQTALDELFTKRRGDIGTIELSCPNTNTALPYIDLVNELLELTVAPDNALPAYQTRGATVDLLVHPEHLSATAYEVLAGEKKAESKDAVYPFNLPFNLWLEESRTYLGQLGVPRHILMDALHAAGHDAALGDAGVAAETLRMSSLEWDLIAQENLAPPRTPAAFWGMEGNASWVADLSKASLLLDKATPPLAERGMEFEELKDLLRSSFIQAAGKLGVWFDGTTCDTSKATLVGLVEEHLKRMHRFIRLSRRLGWTALDLDRAIAALGANVLDKALLTRIAVVRRIQAEINVELPELLTWWGVLDTRRWANRLVAGRPNGINASASGMGLVFNDQLTTIAARAEDESFYDRLFQSRSVSKEPNSAFHVHANGTALLDETTELATQLPFVIGPLGVTGQDLEILLPLLGDTKLSLANLSALYRHVSLARALEVSIRELVSLLKLTGLKPFDAAKPEDTLKLIEEARAMKESTFSISDLDYLLRHVDTKPASMEPLDEPIGLLLLEIGEGLRKVDEDFTSLPAAATAEELRERFAKELAPVVSAAVAATLFPGAGEPLAALLAAAVASVDVEPGTGAQPNPPPANTTQIIDQLFVSFLDPADAKKKLAQIADAAYLKQPDARLRYVLDQLLVYRRRLSKESLVIEKLASAFGLDVAIAAPVLCTHLLDGGAPVVRLFTDIAVSSFEKKVPGSAAPLAPSPIDLPTQFTAYKRLHKVALVLDRVSASKDDLEWFFKDSPVTGALNLTTLPTSPNPANVEYAAWSKLRDAVALRGRTANGKLFDLFSAAALAQASGVPATIDAAHESLLNELTKRTNWNRADIEFLVGIPKRGMAAAKASPLGLAYPAKWTDETALKRVEKVIRVVRRIGLAAETLWPWAAIPASVSNQRLQAEAIKQSVRARYEESQWREIARPIRDNLRDVQRQALAGWLVAHDARFQDSHALFEHFLLDVAMSPCQLTSRIKQASSSVQLFVQRALMNLEPKVKLPAEDAREWKWMKVYRVWEANRKVFLYPENWLEPELRDDKSPFYADLENELQQSEVTPESAEQAVLGYLDKLDDVARLEVSGLFRQKEGQTNILHVIAHTRGTPARYYYRRQVDEARWTPWEKIEVDIEGDHLLPFIYNRRLYLFWLIITEKALEEVPATPAKGGDQVEGHPLKYFQLRLGWSQLRNGKWTGKKLSNEQIGATRADFDRLTTGLYNGTYDAKTEFALRAFETGGNLIIEPLRIKTNIEGSFYPYRIDRFVLSGCDGTISIEKGSADGQGAIVSRPDPTKIRNQTFANFMLGQLYLPVKGLGLGFADSTKTLARTPSDYEVVPIRIDNFRSDRPFFFQDARRSFFVEPVDVQRWVRARPDWTIVDKIPFDLAPTFGGILPRPFPIDPDPGPLSPIQPGVTTEVIGLATRPRVIGNEAAGLGLLESRDSPVSEMLGARLAYVGATKVEGRSNKLALQLNTEIKSSDGKTLLALKSAPPPEAADMQLMTVKNTYVVPSLALPDLTQRVPLKLQWVKDFRFSAFYHPYLCVLMKELNRVGIDGVWDPAESAPVPQLRRQALAHDFFAADYQPADAVLTPYPRDEFDFSYAGAYAPYNWELFLHVPFGIACSLSRNQRFEEAQRWFHYIFDPTESSSNPTPQRFWKIRPFFELFYGEDVEAGPIHELLLLLQYTGSDPQKLRARDLMLTQIAEWRKNPFNPHAIARLRIAAYQKAVVLKYISNLIEWGDQLFRRDTLESINEATQLYVLAAQILGKRPREVKVEPPTPRTYNQLRALGLDQFSNAAIEEVEAYLPEIPENGSETEEAAAPIVGPSLFFCIPPNDKLITDYWDRVADRLFKIRHCMNIEGVVRQLPLFEPPIDPALLIRAAAAGIDLASALNDLNAPLPYVRFQLLSQRATELCADVRSLGQALLAALEKKDVESLALTRAAHEINLQAAMLRVRRDQIAEAKETLAGLRKSKENADVRLAFYRGREFMNTAEKAQFGLQIAAGVLDIAAGVASVVGASVSAIPNFEAGASGFGGSPVVTVKYGGENASNVANAVAAGLRTAASALDRAGNLAGIMGGYERRSDEWGLQADLAQKDAEGLDKQIIAAEIRVSIAEKELENLELQIEQAKEVEEFLRGKYTNAQLYSWMIGQISSLYFQSYKLAYDLAKRAERAWQFELAIPERAFIQFGYWDGLKKGLLAGERLHYDIKRMEVAYVDLNKREYELTRHVSLRQLDPVSLLELRRSGKCLVSVPEVWFDLDSPGHYMRRIKSVAVSIPAVTGPYVPVRCTLTLLASSVRSSPDPAAPKFRSDLVGIQSIVTSRAQEDSGLFETSLADPRYLPFEGAGAISDWRLELPKTFRQFDYETISDVILHVRYTARDGGAPLRTAVEAQLANTLKAVVFKSQEGKAVGAKEGLIQVLSARQEFPDEWQRFLSPPDAAADQSLDLVLENVHFPHPVQEKVRIAGIEVFMAVKDLAVYGGATPIKLQIVAPGTPAQPVDLPSVATEFEGLPHGVVNFGNSTKPLGSWSVKFKEAENTAVAPAIAAVNPAGRRRLVSTALDDLVLAIRYKVT